jgi:hypothetical protein
MFEQLETNRTELKVSMRSKWYKSDNATLQMALMKLLCTPEERKILSMNYVEKDVVSRNETSVIDLDALINYTDDDLALARDRIRQLRESNNQTTSAE